MTTPTYPLEGKNVLARAIEDLTRAGLTLRGRTFRPVMNEITADQHFWTWTKLQKTGINQIAKTFDFRREDALEGFNADLIVKAYDSGQLWDVLAGVLVEDGTTWSKESASENAKFFASITEPSEVRRVMGAMSGVVLSFLLRTVAANMIIPRSSSGPATMAGSPDHSGQAQQPDQAPEPIAAHRRGTTGATRRSSKKSPSSTTRSAKKSRKGGRSGK